MRPDHASAQTLFGVQRVQYSVPHYQRPQAWRAQEHWEPLWSDIEAKASVWFEGGTPEKHYLGAIVLANRPKAGIRGMDRNIVIDGQQRLSTLQYVLKALAILMDEQGYAIGVTSVNRELHNPQDEIMDRPEVQTYKLWPTFRDRPHHLKVMQAKVYGDLLTLFEGHFTKSGSLYVGDTQHPRPLAATVFFYNKISSWLDELEGRDAIHNCLEAVRRAVTESLQLIVLWLEQQDDPQVIFECLNGRGAPLRPTDLIKNFIFMSAEGEPGGQEMTEDSPLFKLWSTLDAEQWLEVLTRGRIKQARVEWLIYYSLQAETGHELDTSRIYNSYQQWAPRGKMTAMEQVKILVSHAESLQAFIDERPDKPIGRLGKVAQALDVTTITPLTLAITASCAPELQTQMFEALSSYLVRRATCQLTTKSYNMTFLAILRELRKNGFTFEVLQAYLLKLEGPTAMWPDDAKFAEAIATSNQYYPGSPLCRLLLAAAANQIGAAHAAEVQWSPDWSTLQLEHLLPQSWYQYWPLADGSYVTEKESKIAAVTPKSDGPEGGRVAAIVHRESLVNRLGNLTILNSEINNEIKNREWAVKRPAIRKATQLRMNFDVTDGPWNDEQIERRGLDLARILSEVFRGPG